MSLDSDQLTWNHQYECRVQVRPAVFNDPHRTPRILFHFSDVEIGPGSCEDANLTVIDGAFRPWDYHHDIVKGIFAANALNIAAFSFYLFQEGNIFSSMASVPLISLTIQDDI